MGVSPSDSYSSRTAVPLRVCIDDEVSLIAIARDLGAANYGGSLTGAEARLIKRASSRPKLRAKSLETIRDAIREGMDPLGCALCFLRPPSKRRGTGTFYTPHTIVAPMVEWILDKKPSRVVDAGCGSGRFTQRVLLAKPSALLIAVDSDPMATLMTRALFAAFKAKNAVALNTNYTTLALDSHDGRSGYISNPPYVRHHGLSGAAKRRADSIATRLGHSISGLAGLHAHFILATANLAKKGDVGAFVTSSEWLDTNYGSIVRELMLNGLGGKGIHAVVPEATPFSDAMTTAAITYFEIGSEPSEIAFSLSKSTDAIRRLEHGSHIVSTTILRSRNRWSHLLHSATQADELTSRPTLGSIARVHRGQATGANAFFVLTRGKAKELGLERFCRPVISKAEEILHSGGTVRDRSELSVLLEVPSGIDLKAHPALRRYLRLGEKPMQEEDAVRDRWIPSHRKSWFSVVAPRPPIVATYMARQAPFFALNPDGLALINVGHGIFPRVDLNGEELDLLVAALNKMRNEFKGRGRTYHGGLEKFEPREMENLPLPPGFEHLLVKR